MVEDNKVTKNIKTIIDYSSEKIIKTYPNIKFIFKNEINNNEKSGEKILYFYVNVLTEYKYFERLFESDMIETQKQNGFFEIRIEDSDIKIFNLFLNIINKNDKVEFIDIDDSLDLYIISDKYGITFIKNSCENVMKEYLNNFDINTKENIITKKYTNIFIKIYDIAKTYCDLNLYNKVMYCLIENMSKKIIKKFSIEDIIYIFEKFIFGNENPKCFNNEKLFVQLSWWITNKMNREGKENIYKKINEITITKLPEINKIEMYSKYFSIKDKKMWKFFFAKLIKPYIEESLQNISKNDIFLIFKIISEKYIFKDNEKNKEIHTQITSKNKSESSEADEKNEKIEKHKKHHKKTKK